MEEEMRRRVSSSSMLAILTLAATTVLVPFAAARAALPVEIDEIVSWQGGLPPVVIHGEPCRTGYLAPGSSYAAQIYQVRCQDPEGSFSLTFEEDDDHRLKDQGWFRFDYTCCPESPGPFSPSTGLGFYERVPGPVFEMHLRGWWAGPGAVLP